MFLDEAIARAKKAAADREQAMPAIQLEKRVAAAGPAVSFARAIARGDGAVRVIAEVKRMSPSAGEIRVEASIGETAASYERAGAAAVSVLTSGFGFGGDPADLLEAASRCRLPLLCKDFLTSEYQLLEARANGASAVLLISEALDGKYLGSLLAFARSIGIDALVEAHAPEGLRRALEAGAGIVGINNRDLVTLQVDLSTTERLMDLLPEGTAVVSESGIKTARDVAWMASLGVDALLVGEALMRAGDPEEGLRRLTGGEARCG